MNQRTIERKVEISGKGIHSGKPVRMVLLPAEAGKGIEFCRVDLPGRPVIPASIDQVYSAERSTNLGKPPVIVRTVEHFLATAAQLGYDNLVVEVDSEELPIVDGSALPFVEIFQQAGTLDQGIPKSFIKIKEPVWVHEEKSIIIGFPKDDFHITCVTEYDHPVIGVQIFNSMINDRIFIEELAGARTFGFMEEIEKLRQRNLALGGDLSNALVITSDGYLSPLRYPNEIVRHKTLDLIGDLALLGGVIHGWIIAVRPYHSLNVSFGKKLNEIRRQKVLGIREIMDVLPHRYPFLMVDRVLEIEDNKRAVGVKNVTVNEPFFQGHYPGNPIMPGVMLIEAMAQVGGLMLLRSRTSENRVPYLAGIDRFRFRKPVGPGDQIIIEANLLGSKGGIGKVHVEARVKDKVVGEGNIIYALVEDKKSE
ncbi:MAG: UDP-3-O-[3-hydroxymyristoyl] N-acetylglucosamine deacetylase [Candidatus Eremiobacteraeota bacterium]|nr:UDP-3-O-[3-hydroxymyristoyl] N-acetylglucosamine deacetylase [Candidatus Eremiobacteraeota bacterium]